MARETTVAVLPDTWTELTDSDVSSITFLNEGPGVLYVKATTGSAPTDRSGARAFPAGTGEKAALLIDLFPGLAGGDRLWALSEVRNTVSVGHA
jgi:hypothetical protein